MSLRTTGRSSPRSLDSGAADICASCHRAAPDGEIVELYDYHEFGLPTITDPNTIVSGRPALLASSAVGNPFLFTGQTYDPETRLYHYRTRPYEPRMGRFISIDSIGVGGRVTHTRLAQS